VAGTPARIVVVDEDPKFLQLCQRALAPPRFEPFVVDDACLARMSLLELSPDLIVCADRMLWIDGKSFLRAVRSAPQLAGVPVLFLTSDTKGQREIEAVMGEGDQCLRRPVPAEILVERVAGAARPVRARPAGGSLLSGSVDRGGLLALLKLCEDARLTGRFVFEARDHALWFDWLAGTAVGQGASPEDPEHDVLERLLDAEAGRYAFEPRPIGDPKSDAGSGPGAEDGTQGPIGRFSVLEVGGRRYQIHTEGAHSPNFAVSTVVAAFGQGLRKLETRWPHPMKRRIDFEQARQLIDRQHDSALQMVQDGALAPQPHRKVWDVLGGGVEGSQLVWVMSLLRDLARERLGSLPALALLRRSQRRLERFYPALGAFEIGEDGHINVRVEDQASARTTLSGWRLPRGAVRAVAAWALAFREETAQLSGPPPLPSLKRATRMIAEHLEAIGFYAAVEEEQSAAAASAARSGAK
jgi:DNA-binding response OmpR family regulator